MLMVAATGPLLALLLVSAFSDGQRLIETAAEQALQLARVGAVQQEQVLESARSLLRVVARVDGAVGGLDGKCGEQLQSLFEDNPQIEALAVSRLQGVTVCGRRPQLPSLTGDERAYFMAALGRPGGSGALGITLSRGPTETPSTVIGVPVPAQIDALPAVVIAALNVDWFSRLRNQSSSFSPPSFQVVDAEDGTVLSRSMQPAAPMGQKFADHPLVQELRRHPEGGTLRADDLDGVARVIGYAPLLGGQRGLFLTVGFTERDVVAQAQRRSMTAIVLAIVVAAAAIGLAWLVAKSALLRPIRSLSGGGPGHRRG